jgi:hypothetical protein
MLVAEALQEMAKSKPRERGNMFGGAMTYHPEDLTE